MYIPSLVTGGLPHRRADADDPHALSELGEPGHKAVHLVKCRFVDDQIDATPLVLKVAVEVALDLPEPFHVKDALQLLLPPARLKDGARLADAGQAGDVEHILLPAPK
jgi:hypothetical protein